MWPLHPRHGEPTSTLWVLNSDGPGGASCARGARLQLSRRLEGAVVASSWCAFLLTSTTGSGADRASPECSQGTTINGCGISFEVPSWRLLRWVALRVCARLNAASGSGGAVQRSNQGGVSTQRCHARLVVPLRTGSPAVVWSSGPGPSQSCAVAAPVRLRDARTTSEGC